MYTQFTLLESAFLNVNIYVRLVLDDAKCHPNSMLIRVDPIPNLLFYSGRLV
jgi:hypothetical protein